MRVALWLSAIRTAERKGQGVAGNRRSQVTVLHRTGIGGRGELASPYLRTVRAFPSKLVSERVPMPEDPRALDDLFSATYEELRRLASHVRRRDPSETLNPTALVNEAYLKLAPSLRLNPESRLHFKRIAARAMRQVLVEAARRRGARKRASAAALITFDESLDAPIDSSDDVLALDDALQDLARMNPRQAMMVEYRFFGGLDLTETAALLEVSESTLTR